MQIISAFLALAGAFLAKISILIGLGYFLHSWGVQGTDLGMAAWIGFITWIKCLAVGLISLLVGGAGLAVFD